MNNDSEVMKAATLAAIPTVGGIGEAIGRRQLEMSNRRKLTAGGRPLKESVGDMLRHPKLCCNI